MGGRGNHGGHEKSQSDRRSRCESRNLAPALRVRQIQAGTTRSLGSRPVSNSVEARKLFVSVVARVTLNEDQFRTRAHLGFRRKDIVDVAGLVASSEEVTLSTSYFWDALTWWNQKLIYLGKSAMIVVTGFSPRVAIPVRDSLVAVERRPLHSRAERLYIQDSS
jgi:hypothetical protein